MERWGIVYSVGVLSLLSSQEKKYRICEAYSEIPPDSPGFARREEAVSSAMKVSIDLIEKNKGNKEILASAVVYFGGVRVRVLFIRNRNKGAQRKWLALLSTDISISEEEIIRIYGMRWDIEVYFKMCKSFLKLAKEFRVRSYDSMIAHTSIVCIRYILLSYESRFDQDNRSFGGLFYECCDEVAEISFNQSFKLIMDLVVKTLHETPFLSDEEVDQILEKFIQNIPSILRKRLLGRAA